MGRSKVNKYSLATEGDQLHRIGQMLDTLELSTVASSLENVENTIRSNNGTYLDFLESLLEKEFADREQARIIRWIRNAKFPAEKSIESFDFSLQPSIDEREIKEIASCRFVKRGQ